jgi:hypothetical protein
MSPGATVRADLGRYLPTVMAGTLAGVGVGLAVVSLLIWTSQGLPRLPQSLSRTPVAIVPSQLWAVAGIVVGALLGHRVPRNPVGWLLMAMGYAMVLILPVALLIAQTQQAFRPAPDPVRQAAWVESSLSTPIVLACLALVALLFPDGHLASRWRRGAAVLTIAAAVSFGAATAFEPSGLVWYPSIANPFAAPSGLERAFALLRPASAVLMLTALVSVVASVARRYQTGDEVTRAQLRWLVFAASIFALCVVPFIVTRYVVATSDALGEVVMALVNTSGAALPIAAAFAITRYRLFGIDRLINRTLVYVPLVGVLGGLYALAVALFQRLFVTITGSPSEVPLLLAVFLIAAVFTPLRKALEGAVDRWARGGPGPSVDSVNAVAGDPASSVALGEPMSALLVPAMIQAETAEPGLRPEAAEADVVAGITDASERRRAAAALAAVRRLETRVTAGGTDDDADAAREAVSRPIGDDGSVACPAGSRVPFSICLGCPYLASIGVAPPEVRCWRMSNASPNH